MELIAVGGVGSCSTAGIDESLKPGAVWSRTVLKVASVGKLLKLLKIESWIWIACQLFNVGFYVKKSLVRKRCFSRFKNINKIPFFVSTELIRNSGVCFNCFYQIFKIPKLVLRCGLTLNLRMKNTHTVYTGCSQEILSLIHI